MNTQGIYLTWIVVKDIETAIKFYTEVVGLKLLQYTPEYGWAELAGPSGASLGLAQENPQEPIRAGANAVATITVDNIITARDRFKTQGVRLLGDILEIPGHVKLQTFVDADGNTMQLVEKLA